jgi:hypothetical protein
MSKSKTTITGGLGLEEKFFEEGKTLVFEMWKKAETISDLLHELSQEIRDRELGEMDSSITSYEKKLILVGFFAGILKCDQDTLLSKAVESISGILGEISGDESEKDE